MSNVVEKNGTNLTEKDEGLVALALGVVTSPLKMFSSDSAGTKKFYSEKVVGAALLGSAVAGFAAGDVWGDNVPVLGRRRK